MRALRTILMNLRARWNVRRYGCHMIAVAPWQGRPRFIYSIGIQKTFGAPDLLVTGLPHDVGRSIIVEYCTRVRDGERPEPDRFHPGFLGGGFNVMFRPVEKAHYADWLGFGRWFYDGDGFDCLQVIFPTTDDVWPWDPDVPEDYREGMPLLCADKGPPRSQEER